MESRSFLNSRSAARYRLSGGRLLLGGLLLAVLPARALELGPVQMLSGLGEPLSLQLPVRWSAGETHSSACLQVGVEAGERRLAAANLQQRLLKGADAHSALIWVRSKVAVMEPVLMLSIGCPVQQLSALVDPVRLMVAPAGGVKAAPLELLPLEQADSASGAGRSKKRPIVRDARAGQRNQLRLSEPSLPVLSMADAETPGLRWRFDSDLDEPVVSDSGGRKGRAFKGEPFYVRPGAPGASLLMAIDVGRAAGPADLLMAQDGAERLARTQAQFGALQADHRALKLELEKLTATIAERESASRLQLLLAAGVAVLAAGGAFLFWRRASGR